MNSIPHFATGLQFCIGVRASSFVEFSREQFTQPSDYQQNISKIIAEKFGSLRYFSYLCTCEREGYGHIGSTADHDGRDAVDARDDRLAAL